MKDYKTVKEVALATSLSPRWIRKQLNEIKDNHPTKIKFERGKWLIHQDLIPEFEPKNIKRKKFYSFSFQSQYEMDLNLFRKHFQLLALLINDDALTGFCSLLSIEKRFPIIHGYFSCANKSDFIEALKKAFQLTDGDVHVKRIHDVGAYHMFLYPISDDHMKFIADQAHTSGRDIRLDYILKHYPSVFQDYFNSRYQSGSYSWLLDKPEKQQKVTDELSSQINHLTNLGKENGWYDETKGIRQIFH